MQDKPVNPLAGWYRQPKIYTSLPSKGKFYKEGSLDKSVNSEYPVFAMTAKDELMFKTPDALLNGQSTVEVIKSCIPAILDPWNMPVIDLDAVLIAIRIATYGDNMEIGANCPHCEGENHYDINIVKWLDHLKSTEFVDVIECDPLTLHVEPYTYKELTEQSLKTLEHQRIIEIVNDNELTDQQKVDMFGESFIKLTNLSIDIVAKCVKRIDTPDGSSTDPVQIRDFIHNCSREIFEKLSNHLQTNKQNMEIPPVEAQCEHCEGKFVMPVTMDQSNFFAARS